MVPIPSLDTDAGIRIGFILKDLIVEGLLVQ